jgi:hypothetical protein
MADSPIAKTTRKTLAFKPASPDGKGQRGFLADAAEAAPRGVVAKPQPQILAEFFTSMLVLSAEFSHKPAVGVSNFLYFIDGRWSLSLIAPEQWSRERQQAYAGMCTLQHDRTWTIKLAEAWDDKPQIVAAIQRAYDAFARSLDTDGTLEQILPFFVGNLRYYQRLNAFSLGTSIRASMTLGDQRDIPTREWLPALPDLTHAVTGSFRTSAEAQPDTAD